MILAAVFPPWFFDRDIPGQAAEQLLVGVVPKQ